mmetsp:Transcript_28189/g.74443  ORF Transcript_28189/g.74443 Transcript_28189/m.74443 type:complete len:98 (-) Transcript_28189:2125-2418(-)
MNSLFRGFHSENVALVILADSAVSKNAIKQFTVLTMSIGLAKECLEIPLCSHQELNVRLQLCGFVQLFVHLRVQIDTIAELNVQNARHRPQVLEAKV